MTTLLRPDDTTTTPRPLVSVEAIDASEGGPYMLERRRGGVIRLAREQRNGTITSIVFSPGDAIAVGAALITTGEQLGGGE